WVNGFCERLQILQGIGRGQFRSLRKNKPIQRFSRTENASNAFFSVRGRASECRHALLKLGADVSVSSSLDGNEAGVGVGGKFSVNFEMHSAGIVDDVG